MVLFFKENNLSQEVKQESIEKMIREELEVKDSDHQTPGAPSSTTSSRNEQGEIERSRPASGTKSK